jgi:ATP-dependent Clp protease ATP-binding subunit ClpC
MFREGGNLATLIKPVMWRYSGAVNGGEMFERFTDRARRVVVLAQEEARMLNHNYVGTEHLLLGLIHEGEGVAAVALEALGISLESLRRQVEEIIGQGRQPPSGHIPFTPRTKKALELSLREALQLGHNYIGTEHILLGLIREGEGVAAQMLVRRGADLNRARQQVIQLLHGYQTHQPTVLEVPLRNLTAEAQEGRLAPVLGRRAEIEQVAQILARETPGNLFLVGERGAGVSAVVYGLVELTLRPEVPSALAGMQVVEVDLNPLDRAEPAGAFLENTLTALRDRIRELRNTILFIERACIQRGELSRLPIPAVSFLRPELAAGGVPTIAAATPAELAECLAADASLRDSFETVEIAGLSAGLAVRVLGEIRDRYEARHRVEITDAAIAAAVALSGEYLPGRPLPGRAISLLDQAAAETARRHDLPPGSVEQDVADVRAQKNAAIDSQDFEKAAALRDREKALLAVMREQAATEERRNVPAHRVVAVTEEEVATVAAAAATGRA